MTQTTSTYSGSGRYAVQVHYACKGPHGEREVGAGELVWAAAWVYLGFFGLVVFPIVAWLGHRIRARASRLLGRGGGQSGEQLLQSAVDFARKSGADVRVVRRAEREEADDPAVALRTLQRMRDEGLVTAEEFAAKKAEILDRL